MEDEESPEKSLGRDIPSHPRLLLVSMYPLSGGLWGPTVRITHLRDELARLVRLDVVSGYRPARRLGLIRYLVSGRLRGLDAIYVESASTLPAETDFAFLAVARMLGIPVLTYFRDAYQLFPEYYVADSIRRKVSALAYGPLMRGLAALSTIAATPSRGLAQALLGDRRSTLDLPPGSPPPVTVQLAEDADCLLFVGNARDLPQGADRLINAVGTVRSRGLDLKLLLVCRQGEEPRGVLPDFADVLRAEGSQITELLPRVIATVIPRQQTSYNDLALPVKLFEYLAYGRPLLVTNCRETARVVRDAACGIIVGDDPVALANGITRLVAMSAAEREGLGGAARAAALAASWSERAHRIVRALGLPTSRIPTGA
jgi:glycosyltransferase involved in cell wall biosynthesis